MDTFIKMRQSFVKTQSSKTFYLSFLENYDRKASWKESDKERLAQQIEAIKLLNSQTLTIPESLSYLGKDDYLNDLIISQVIKKALRMIREEIKQTIKDRLQRGLYNNVSFYALFDISNELKLEVVNEKEWTSFIEKYKEDNLILSILLEYAILFKIDVEEKLVYLLDNDYPAAISTQLLQVMYADLPVEYVKKKLATRRDLLGLYQEFIAVETSRHSINGTGLFLLQSMFHGDFDDSGKGNNGGLAVLLRSLGDELAANDETAAVITLAVQEECKKPLIKEYGNNHFLIRLPIYLDEWKKDRFIQRERFINRSVSRFLSKVNWTPDVFHVRYLDNASKALADLGKAMGSKVVATLTPDPHRGLSDADGELREMNYQELLEVGNKLKIGDDLIEDSDCLIGIGEMKIKKELESHFPQLKKLENQQKVVMISEGIILEKTNKNSLEKKSFLDKDVFPLHFFDKPTLLNVGRLNPVKGQDQLLKAWGDSALWKEYNLLIIGGDLNRLNADERSMVAFFKSYIKKNPHLKNHFHHLAALPNEEIRRLEKEIIKKTFYYPHIYLCSSKKEEFGLAILEALAQTFLVIGPIKGGVKSYLENGKNGFLIDTTNSKTIASETESILAYLKDHQEEVATIRKAGKKTVFDQFSLRKIAVDFLSTYRAIL